MKLGVCVPYRNREFHLKEFVPKVGKYLEEKVSSIVCTLVTKLMNTCSTEE